MRLQRLLRLGSAVDQALIADRQCGVAEDASEYTRGCDDIGACDMR
jgi:hypothetical protein